jgi:hypothetical protein
VDFASSTAAQLSVRRVSQVLVAYPFPELNRGPRSGNPTDRDRRRNARLSSPPARTPDPTETRRAAILGHKPFLQFCAFCEPPGADRGHVSNLPCALLPRGVAVQPPDGRTGARRKGLPRLHRSPVPAARVAPRECPPFRLIAIQAVVALAVLWVHLVRCEPESQTARTMDRSGRDTIPLRASSRPSIEPTHSGWGLLPLRTSRD